MDENGQKTAETATGMALTVGTYDGVHRGHQHMLRVLRSEARARGLEAGVLTFSAHPLHVIRPSKRAPGRLTGGEQQRERLRASGIERVITLDFTPELRAMTAREFMTMLRDRYGVRLLVMGYNNRFGSDGLSSGEDFCRAGADVGIEVVIAPEYRTADGMPISSSAVRHAVSDGNITLANSMLGYRYTLIGRVVSGHKIGRTLGFPTANIEPIDSEQLLPLTGVYVADVTSDVLKKTYRAVVNIGRRPTIEASADAPITIEAHLIGYDGDLYGQVLRLQLLRRLRGEERFASAEALRERIAQDCAEALQEPTQQTQKHKI